ncbi:hypothetical protein [Rossellomorea aquimaris]|uniref:hypothetical protein n=1 Tax=Rossellomorea aquimaris TaxID=189382 RepID=UPI0007D0844F|nr:hypothetical protein [Rossellomorea aquimaris]
MSGIRRLSFAATDKYGGSTNLLHTTPYLSRKPIQLEGPLPYLEHLSIVLTVYFDLLINYTKGHPVHEMMEDEYPMAVDIARDWSDTNKLNDTDLSIEDVFTMLINEQLDRNPILECI